MTNLGLTLAAVAAALCLAYVGGVVALAILAPVGTLAAAMFNPHNGLLRRRELAPAATIGE